MQFLFLRANVCCHKGRHCTLTAYQSRNRRFEVINNLESVAAPAPRPNSTGCSRRTDALRPH